MLYYKNTANVVDSMIKRSRRKTILRILSLCLVAGVLWTATDTFILVRLRAPLPELKPQTLNVAIPAPTKPAVSLSWPAYGSAAVGLSGYGVLATNGFQTPLPTASVAKLITALAVLRAKPIALGSQGATLTLGQQDVDYYNTYAAEDGSVAAVNADEQISEYQVLQGMLLPSANNLADSLAVWAFGSLKDYAAYANHMLSQLGLLNTHVGSDASGFQPDTTSTAADLVHLGELADANPVLASIAAQKSATIPIADTVNNVDWLLGTAGINGLKTGNSNQAGGVFLAAATYQIPGSNQKVTIISAVMHAASLQQAMDSTVPLLVSSQKALSNAPALAVGQAVGQYTVPWEGQVTAVTTKALTTLSWQGRPLGKPVVMLHDIRAPQPSQVPVGVARFESNGITVSSAPITLGRPIPKPSVWWRLLHN